METRTTSTPCDGIARVYAYADGVLNGSIPACKKVIMSCRRFRDDLKRSKEDPAWPWVFDETRAMRPISFMERFLVPSKGDYDRFELMPWQCFCEANLYGWVDRVSGLRRFNEGLIAVGRGNGKTTMLSGNAAFGVSKDQVGGNCVSARSSGCASPVKRQQVSTPALIPQAMSV